VKREFLTQPKFNIHRLLQFVSFPGLRADVCSDGIGDEHGQGVIKRPKYLSVRFMPLGLKTALKL